ncbi:hypothetical protein HDU67_007934, partial [Dinochytrium kinnereticum]
QYLVVPAARDAMDRTGTVTAVLDAMRLPVHGNRPLWTLPSGEVAGGLGCVPSCGTAWPSALGSPVSGVYHALLNEKSGGEHPRGEVQDAEGSSYRKLTGLFIHAMLGEQPDYYTG